MKMNKSPENNTAKVSKPKFKNKMAHIESL
jgi:hypothetical protein